MKTYKHLYEQMITPEAVKSAALDAAAGKVHRGEVLSAFARFDDTFDEVMAAMNDPDYRPCEDNTHQIIDGANHKQREIEKPMFCPEQIIHHLLINPFKPVLLNGLYEQVYGCLPPSTTRRTDGTVKVRRYGPHAAIAQLRKWVQAGSKIYVCEADVHHAYASVHIPTLAAQLRRSIKDERWISLAFKFLHFKEGDPACDDLCGLVLGHYTSPWFFNFYLKDLDHFAAAQDGVKYLRFADNFYFVGPNKRKVHAALDASRAYLRRELRMELNGSTQVYRFEYQDKRTGKVRGRAVNALGAVIHFNRVTLRKSILMRTRRKARRIHKKGGRKTTWHDGASMLARLSWIRHTDTYSYYLKHIKPFINTRQLKAKVRRHSRELLPAAAERRRLIYDGLEKSTRLAA